MIRKAGRLSGRNKRLLIMYLRCLKFSEFFNDPVAHWIKDVMDFWIGLFITGVGAYFLYRNSRGEVRLTFRAGLYMWLLILAGIAIAFGLLG